MARRPFGKVRKLPSGKYQASYVHDGERHNAPMRFTHMSYARDWLVGQQAEIQRGTWTQPVEARAVVPTFGELAATVLAERPLRPSTAGNYRRLLRCHLLPRFGETRADRITVTEVAAWWGEYGNRTPATRADAYRLLASLMKEAVNRGYCDRSPCRVPRGGADRRVHEIEAATPEQIEALADGMPPRWRMLVLLGAYCQLRFGELAALQRKDVDTGRAEIRVRRAMTRVDGQVHTGPPKTTAGLRTLAVPPDLLGELAAHLAEHVATGNGALVFTTPRGAQLYHAVFFREWSRARESAGLAGFHFHDLRHTGLTWLARNGATLAERMHRAGHADPRMAIRYEHADARRDAANAAQLSRPGGVVVPMRRSRRGS